MRPTPKEIVLDIRVEDLSVNFGKQGRTKSSKIVREMLLRTVDKVLENVGKSVVLKYFRFCVDFQIKLF